MELSVKWEKDKFDFGKQFDFLRFLGPPNKVNRDKKFYKWLIGDHGELFEHILAVADKHKVKIIASASRFFRPPHLLSGTINYESITKEAKSLQYVISETSAGKPVYWSMIKRLCYAYNTRPLDESELIFEREIKPFTKKCIMHDEYMLNLRILLGLKEVNTKPEDS